MGIKSLQFLSLVLQMEPFLLAILLISDISLSLVIRDASFLEDELSSLLLLPVEVHPVTIQYYAVNACYGGAHPTSPYVEWALVRISYTDQYSVQMHKYSFVLINRKCTLQTLVIAGNILAAIIVN